MGVYLRKRGHAGGAGKVAILGFATGFGRGGERYFSTTAGAVKTPAGYP